MIQKNLSCNETASSEVSIADVWLSLFFTIEADGIILLFVTQFYEVFHHLNNIWLSIQNYLNFIEA